MDPFATRRIGRTDVEVTLLGLGGGTLGDPDEIISEAQAEATLEAAYDEGVRLFDTAPWYGNTKSEHRMGHHLRQRPRRDFRLTTKVGRVYSRPSDPKSFDFPRWKGGLHFDLCFDYTRDGVLRSYEQSLQRLGINTVDALI
ncbi:MAG: aldo/keto reductase, partial [Pseudomonadota bacterium]|nr:aldo/keto reductase [Pseudomonadota bacterium]